MDVRQEYFAKVIEPRTLSAYCAAVAAGHYQDIVGAPFTHMQPEDCRLSDEEKRSRSWVLWSSAQAKGIVV